MDAKCKEIVKSRVTAKMIPIGEHPEPGEYVITGMQFGNIHGELGWHKYIGYVVQVRKEAGAYGSDLVLLRHPDGELCSHENQFFHRMSDYWQEKVKALYPEGVSPENEDYSEAYTLGDKYPEVGKVIEPKESDRPIPSGPMTAITVEHGDGTRTVEVIV